MTEHFAFSALGNVTIDDLVFQDGRTMWRVPGGNAVYSALGMAIWQERPAVVAPIGLDYPVEGLNDRVDVTHCRRIAHTLRDWGLYEDDGSRQFVFRAETRDWLAYSPTVEDVAHFTCDFAHLAPLRWNLQVTLAVRLKAAGTKIISVDPDDRYLNELSNADMTALFLAADLFLPSKQDAEALLPGRTLPDTLRELRERAPEAALIVIKAGADGVIMHAKGAADYLVIPSAAEDVVDTTGAGDAFSGGALVGFARTRSGLDAALYGSVSASYAVASNGPKALASATMEDAQHRLDRLRSRTDGHPL